MMELSIETRSALIAKAIAEAPCRIPLKGSSMLPDLHEGMLLEARPVHRTPHVGEIVIFRAGSRLVAHRVTGVRGDRVICAGDAQPDCLDAVEAGDVIARVCAVYDAAGKRVDGAAMHLRGVLRARLRAWRSLLFRALPQTRPRAYASLYAVTSAVVRGDTPALIAAVRATQPWRIAAMARRHRCAALLCTALEDAADDEYAQTLHVQLQKDKWSAQARAGHVRAQVSRLLQALNAAGLEPLLLKGAQRLACDEEGAELFDCQDIDVMLAQRDLDRAREALCAEGYFEGEDAASPLYARHHHAAPLYLRGGIPIELHRALTALPLAAPRTWEDLQRYAMRVYRPGGSLTVLDRVGTALHLAIHAMSRPALRELVLLARQLRSLDSFEMQRFRAAVSLERRYAVKVGAPVFLAAQLAGIDWACDANVRRFARWMLQREDLPQPLRARPECFDAWLSARENGFSATFGAAFDGQTGSPARRIARAAARLCAGAAIAVYVRFMR